MTSHWELIALAVVILLVFGSKQLPSIARSLGRSARELKETAAGVDPREDVRRALEAPRELERTPDDGGRDERSVP